MKLTAEVQMMLEQKIIPFWLSLQDDHYGGFVSYVDLNLRRNEKAEKGCILNSRILWFFFRSGNAAETSGPAAGGRSCVPVFDAVLHGSQSRRRVLVGDF